MVLQAQVASFSEMRLRPGFAASLVAWRPDHPRRPLSPPLPFSEVWRPWDPDGDAKPSPPSIVDTPQRNHDDPPTCTPG